MLSEDKEVNNQIFFGILMIVFWIVIPQIKISILTNSNVETILNFVKLFVLCMYILHFIPLIKRKGFFESTFEIYMTSFLSVFALTYFFGIIGSPMLAAGSLIFGIGLVIAMTAFGSWFLLFKWKKGFWVIFVLYVLVSFTTIVLGGYMFALVHDFSGNSIVFTNTLPGQDLELGAWDYVYYTAGAFYSSNFGDLSPVNGWTRALSMIFTAIGAILHVFILGWIFSKGGFENGKNDENTTKSKPKKASKSSTRKRK